MQLPCQAKMGTRAGGVLPMPTGFSFHLAKKFPPKTNQAQGNPTYPITHFNQVPTLPMDTVCSCPSPITSSPMAWYRKKEQVCAENRRMENRRSERRKVFSLTLFSPRWRQEDWM